MASPNCGQGSFLAAAKASDWSHAERISQRHRDPRRPDEESVLAWAREDFACIVFNLHTEHSEMGIGVSADAFRALIDLALVRRIIFPDLPSVGAAGTD